MRILVAALVKNEAQRFLPSALKAWGDFADHILVLDDNSTDDSVEICQAAGVEVISSSHTKSMWGAESPLRQQLWLESCKRTSTGDFIFVLDADMIPAKNPKDLLQPHTDAIAFPLYDLWAEYSDGHLMYREDQFWNAHNSPRTWLVKKPSYREWKWNTRGIHSGHFPLNLDISNPIFAPSDYGLLHYAYINNNLRVAKMQQYASVSQQLSPGETQHARSIIDQSPHLKPLNFSPNYKLTCES